MKKTTMLWVNFSSGISCTAARSHGISFFVDNSLLVIPIHLLITPFFFFFFPQRFNSLSVTGFFSEAQSEGCMHM